MISGNNLPAHAELTWDQLDIGGVKLQVRQTIIIIIKILYISFYSHCGIIIHNCHIFLQFDSACERCKMVNIDQDTSENIYKPMSILTQHKWQGKIVFGIYMNRKDTEKCKIRVGQKCTVINKK